MAVYSESDFQRELESEILGETSYEGIFESDHEADHEADQFFGALAGLAKKAISSPALRKVASDAGRAALRSAMSAVQGWLGESDPEAWGESELVFEDHEGSWEWSPETAYEVQVEAIMEHLGHAAAQAETEEEAFAFLAPLLPLAAKAVGGLAAKALPVAAKGLAKVGGGLLKKAAPHMLRGVKGLASNLFKSKARRPLLRAVPQIVRKTAQNVVRQAASGRRVTPQTAVRTLAQTAQRTLNNPQQLVRAYRRSKSFDRRMHRPAPPPPPPMDDRDILGGDMDNGVDEFVGSCPTCGH